MHKDQAESICREHQYNKINFAKVGKFISNGVEGHVYSYGKKRVIKFCHPRDMIYCNRKAIRHVIETTKRYKAFAKVYEYGFLKRSLFWVVVEFLPKKLEGRSDAYCLMKSESEVSYNEKYKLPKKWRTFISSIKRYQKKHGFMFTDWHDGNILVSKDGNLKLIDYVSSMEELDD